MSFKFLREKMHSVIEYVIVLAVVAIIITALFPGSRGAIAGNSISPSATVTPTPSATATGPLIDPQTVQTLLLILAGAFGLAILITICFFAFTAILRQTRRIEEVKREQAKKRVEMDIHTDQKNETVVLNHIDPEFIEQMHTIAGRVSALTGDLSALDLDIEAKHALSRLLNSDLGSLFESYSKLDGVNRTNYRSKIVERINTIINYLNELELMIEQKNIHDVEKVLNLIDMRYHQIKNVSFND